MGQVSFSSSFASFSTGTYHCQRVPDAIVSFSEILRTRMTSPTVGQVVEQSKNTATVDIRATVLEVTAAFKSALYRHSHISIGCSSNERGQTECCAHCRRWSLGWHF